VSLWLLDTGPAVAYLDLADPSHQLVTEALDPFRGQLVTTSAVVTEVMHFVAADSRGPRALLDFLTAGSVGIYDFCRPPEMAEAVALMEKYFDIPMDFADATLVLLAETIGCRDVLTLDRRGFSAYRIRQREPFLNVLDLQ
jgi:hypothetical protein